MEDKELQELFAAKRTAEANRRRQEELATMIVNKSKRTRPLWPVWAGAAAASVALLLIALPALFRSETTKPILVAEAILPQKEEPTQYSSSPKLGEGDPRNEGEGVCQKPISHTPPSTLRVSTPSILEGELADAVEEPAKMIEEPTKEFIEEPIEEFVEEPTESAPRIHRRTSTMLACTEGCSAPADIQERHSNSIQIEFFASQEYADATVYTFANKKTIKI